MVSSSIPAGLGAQYALKVLNGAASAPAGGFSLAAGTAGQVLPTSAGGGGLAGLKGALAAAAGATSASPSGAATTSGAAPGLVTAIRRQFEPPGGQTGISPEAAGRSYSHASAFIDARSPSRTGAVA